ncbi:deoxyribonuclease IV [Candidatus Gastranaerophilus sp. (ex Termes propinquus)]|nr:deoxyribonuclease IV [Candidatus Gastranaerophilus sp. (ex Termes propinquus)]
MNKIADKLHFLTAGIPGTAKSYEAGFEVLRELGLDGLELEFVHGVRISEASKESVRGEKNLVFTAHAPYYINLASLEEKKIESSIEHVLETARMADSLGAYSVVYHAGYYMKRDPKTVFEKMLEANKKIFDTLDKEGNKIWLRPETTGKGTQWGSLDEIVDLCKHFKTMLPCVDFAHLHARSNGQFNTYKEFCSVFEKIGNTLGEKALKNFHAHVAGIEYSAKGEKRHLNLLDSDFNYKDLMKAFKEFNVKGVLVCESPNIERDCKLLKDYYDSLK